jgi:hypothetical protein
VSYAQAPTYGQTLAPGCLYFSATQFSFLPTTSQATYARWLQSVALAFLEGHVRQDTFARQWLQSNSVGIASRGVAEWSRK